MSEDLKDTLVKLGTTNPALRPHIRPVLATLKEAKSAEEVQLVRDMAKEGFSKFKKTTLRDTYATAIQYVFEKDHDPTREMYFTRDVTQYEGGSWRVRGVLSGRNYKNVMWENPKAKHTVPGGRPSGTNTGSLADLIRTVLPPVYTTEIETPELGLWVVKHYVDGVYQKGKDQPAHSKAEAYGMAAYFMSNGVL